MNTVALRARQLTIPLAVGFLALSLTACTSLGTQPVRDETGQITEANDSADVFAVTVGDCTNDDSMTSGEVATVATVPCAEPHDNEAYSSGTLPDGDFPGSDAVAAAADEMCFAGFETFVGLDYDSSRLDYYPMTPTEGSWGAGDHEVLCFVYDSTGAQLTGTAKGLAE
jgi:hypothetical protein